MSVIKPKYRGIRLNCVITSDNHIDVRHPMPRLPRQYLLHSLRDSQASAVPMDAYITVGDTTSRGSARNWAQTRKCFARCHPAKHIFLTLGNHDTWNDSGYDAAIANYYDAMADICGLELSVPYYAAEVNGYRMIFLGSLRDAGCETRLGEAQLQWLEAQLKLANDQPCFVFCHQSLNGRHGLPRTWERIEDPNADPAVGGIGPESDAVAAILKAHKNVFYFSGHSHMGLGGEVRKGWDGYATFEIEDGLRRINLPSLACGNHHGDDERRGLGVVLEVYDDRVVIRPRDFVHRRMNRSVMIQDGKPYFEVKID